MQVSIGRGVEARSLQGRERDTRSDSGEHYAMGATLDGDQYVHGHTNRALVAVVIGWRVDHQLH